RLPVTEINHTLARVLFPAFSTAQGDAARLREMYFKALTLVIFFTAPLSFGIFATAPHFIPVLLGEQWTATIPYIRIFAVLGLLVSIGSTTTDVFRSMG